MANTPTYKTLYQKSNTRWTDPWGHTHLASQIDRTVRIYPTTKTVKKNNGHHDYEAMTAESAGGETFWKHQNIDYGPNTIWYDKDNKPWYERISGRVVWPDGTPFKHDDDDPEPEQETIAVPIRLLAEWRDQAIDDEFALPLLQWCKDNLSPPDPRSEIVASLAHMLRKWGSDNQDDTASAIVNRLLINHRDEIRALLEKEENA